MGIPARTDSGVSAVERGFAIHLLLYEATETSHLWVALCDATMLITAYADALGPATRYARADARPEHHSRTGAEPDGAGQGCGAGQPNVC